MNLNIVLSPPLLQTTLIDLFIYLKSTTEGPEGHLYCRKNTETHKKTKKTNKQTI